MKPLDQNPLSGKEIIFPVTYNIKVVVTQNMNATSHRELIEGVFERLKIPFEYQSMQPSKQNTYLSFSFRITLTDKALMMELYGELQKIPWFKFAI